MSENLSKKVIVIVVILGVGALVGITSSEKDIQENSSRINGTLLSSEGIAYQYSIFLGDLKANITIENPTSQSQKSSLEVEVDTWSTHVLNSDLNPGESSTHEIDLRESIDVLNDTHTVTLSTFGNSTDVTFTTTEADLERNSVPKPHISDVEIVTDVYDGPFNTTLDGKTFTMANVTVTNPTNQLYSMKLMVHSLETGGGWYLSAVSRGENRTIQAVLDEEFGETVAGEARLYTGKPSESAGALDQAEFVGRAGGETAFYTRSYQPVAPPWEENPYQYENESVARGDGVLGTDVESPGDVPVAAYVGGLLLLLGVLIYRRRQ